MRVLIILIVAAFSLDAGFGQPFTVQHEPKGDKIEIYKRGLPDPVVTQVAKADMRPFLHPILPPDGKGVLTEIHPEHHLHQTGVYWGLKKANGRDFFMNHGGTHYRKVDVEVLVHHGDSIAWRTRYHLLDTLGKPILEETMNWKLSELDNAFSLDLEWRGEALQRMRIEQFFVGGLFLRMPWFKGIEGEAINSEGERNAAQAEGRRARWMDIGMAIEGREDWGRIAVLDHPDNEASPSPWRVDKQLGVGPSRQILGDWSLKNREIAIERYRLVIYAGNLDKLLIERRWEAFAESD